MAAISIAESSASRKSSGRAGVLIVDGDASTCADLKQALQDCDFIAFVAENGIEAIDTYRRHQDEIAIAVIDVALPGLDGVQTLSALRIINSGMRACFISDGNLDAQYLLDRGAEHVFGKPIQPADVCDYLAPA